MTQLSPSTSLFALLFLSTFTLAQEAPEYGEFSELRGLRKVYIQSYDFEARKMLIAEIAEQVKKKKVDLEVVGAPEDADMHVLFGTEVAGQGAYTTQYAELAVAIRGKLLEGEMVKPEGTGRYRYRIVFSAKSSRGLRWQRNPVKKALQKFLKDLGKLQREGGVGSTFVPRDGGTYTRVNILTKRASG